MPATSQLPGVYWTGKSSGTSSSSALHAPDRVFHGKREARCLLPLHPNTLGLAIGITQGYHVSEQPSTAGTGWVCVGRKDGLCRQIGKKKKDDRFAAEWGETGVGGGRRRRR
eukprot:Sspe_Gene.91780::Locus_63401_Transcript_1_1_Confidence_1.000_Length_467::g.91780::m.91780